MKKILLLAVLALALPAAMFADSSIDYTNSGGVLSGSSAGLSLSGSILIAVNGLNGGGTRSGFEFLPEILDVRIDHALRAFVLVAKHV